MRKLFSVFVCLTTCAVALAAEKTKEAERLHRASGVVNEIMATPEKAIPQDLLDKAVCVGVIPSEVKFALGVGGSFGRGALVCPPGRYRTLGPAVYVHCGRGKLRISAGRSGYRYCFHRDEPKGCSEVGAKQRQIGCGRLGSGRTGGPQGGRCYRSPTSRRDSELFPLTGSFRWGIARRSCPEARRRCQ